MKRLIEKIAQMQNPSVVGLDSLLDYIPQHIKDEKFEQYGDSFDAAAQAILEYNKAIIDAICDIVPAIKPQAAYYELYSWQGMWALSETVRYAQSKGMIVIMDGKRNDIGSTMQAYAKAHLATGTGAANGVGLQAAMAQVWGQMQVLFEDTSIETVYFMNPLDVADYLGSAQISTQTAFGMSYIQNFLGMGTAILASDVPKGKIYATAAENIVLYYIPVTGADMGQAFALTADATGLIGIHTGPTYNNLSAETVAASGVGLFAEKLDGIVVATINGATDDGLDNLTVTSAASSTTVPWNRSSKASTSR